ncbi:MAG: DUF368 domain-containing protein [Methanobacteriaceae archaeon]
MGSADVIPGVSGGTIALITGIYERLVHSISKIEFSFIKPLFKRNFRESKKLLLKEIDFPLFIPLFGGVAIAILSLSKVIGFLLSNYEALTFAFFLGLILSSAYVLYTHLPHISAKSLGLAILGFIFGVVFVGLNPIATNHSLVIIFFSGMLAICAMILPGISGAFILLLIGQYDYMLNALNTLKFDSIIVFIAGAVIGLLGFSKVLDKLIKNHKDITIAFLIGLMVGTLRIPVDKIVPEIQVSQELLLPVIVLMVIGFLLIVILEKKFNYIK